MKKILLLISCLIISVTTAFAAAGLNPYAYKLEYAGQSDNNRKMTIKYWLNAPAESVSITVSYMQDDAPQVVNYTGTTQEGENIVTVSTAGLPANTPLSWSVTVNQTTKTKPTQISTYHRLYCPQGVAVNTNPYSQHFGRVFVTESLHNRNGSGYVSSKDGKIQAGIYTFSPQFQLEGSIGDPKGDKNFSQVLTTFKSETWTNTSFDGGHQPYQIKISEDDRIFVSSGDKRSAGAVIWELDTNNLETLTPIIRHTTKTFNSNYQILNDDGSFFAGFNCSMDVKGSGDDLTLLLYSANRDGVHAHHKDAFRLDEYQIGTKKSYDDEVSITQKNISYFSKKTYGVVYDKVNVIYDYDGGYWFAASRGIANNTTEPNLAHVRQDGTEDTRSYTNEFYGGAGIMLHKATYEGHRGETWLFKGLSRVDASNGRFGIWKIYKTDGKTTRSRLWTVTSSGLGRNHNAFAIDYAENLFVVGNSGERIIAYALPYEGSKTTPAAQSISLNPVDNSQTYQVTINVTPAGAGTTTGEGRYHYEEQVTLTATPSDPNRYEFVRWVANENHPENPFSFKITGDVTITAEFQEKKYKVQWFNLFQDGQDITTYIVDPENATDKGVNSRVWRWMQVAYNQFINKGGYKSRSDQKDMSKDGKTLFNVGTFLSYPTVNDNANYNVTKFLTTSTSPFYWLGQYIKNESSKTIDSNADWYYHVFTFINRHNKAYNGLGVEVSSDYYYNFSEKGKPTYWRDWWTDIACKLPKSMTFDEDMPIDWTKATAPSGTITDADNNKTVYDPSTWYKWNPKTEDANKLLGWFYGDPDPTTWASNPKKIVHHVDQPGNLIATWLDKEIHEAKNNYDVAKLMTTQGTTHDVSVYHRLQAGMYNTICLPFNVSSLPSDWENATVLRLVSSELENEELTEETLSDNNVNLYFEQVDFTKGEQMYAGYPYLIMPQSDVTGWVTFAGVNKDSVYTGEGKSFVTDYVAMHGHINPSEIDVDPNTLFLVANNRLATPSENGEMLGLRGYFTLREAAAAYSLGEQSVMHIGKKVTTDTPEVPEEEEEVEITQPTINKPKKVMYQGQIYILRGNEVYDLNGRLLRKQ